MKKIKQILISFFRLVIEFILILFYSRLLEYIGGAIIWILKGFKTSFKDEINNCYEDNNSCYKKMTTSHFIGGVAVIFILLIVAMLLKMKRT
jgi:hypothetical protein